MKVCARERDRGEEIPVCVCLEMCRCKVLFERLSVNLMGKR